MVSMSRSRTKDAPPDLVPAPRSETKERSRGSVPAEAPAKAPLAHIREHFGTIKTASAQEEKEKDSEVKKEGDPVRPVASDVPLAASVFPTLRCFHSISSGIVNALARVAQRHHFPAPTEAEMSDLLIRENSHENDMLWVVEHGSVQCEERGEVLGVLEAGACLGLSVVLGHTERQLFTARRVRDDALTLWGIPHAAVSSACRQSPDVKNALEDVLEKQIRKLFMGRIARTVFFNHCCKHFFQPLQGQMKLEFHKRNTVLYRDCEAADSMLIMVHGTCQVLNPSVFDQRLAFRNTGKHTVKGNTFPQRVLAQLNSIRDEQERQKETRKGAPGSGGGGGGGSGGGRKKSCLEASSTTLGRSSSRASRQSVAGGHSSSAATSRKSSTMHMGSTERRRGGGRRSTSVKRAEDLGRKRMSDEKRHWHRQRSNESKEEGSRDPDPKDPGRKRMSDDKKHWQPTRSCDSKEEGDRGHESKDESEKEGGGEQRREDREDGGHKRSSVMRMASRSSDGSKQGQRRGDGKEPLGPMSEDREEDELSELASLCGSSSYESSGESGSDRDEVVSFALPESKSCLEPSFDKASVVAGPPAVVFGDGSVLGFQLSRRCSAVACSDCVFFVVTKQLFTSSLRFHAQETRHFDQMAAARYQEWHHCGLSHLPDIDMFCQCSSGFLSALAQVAQPRLYFSGDCIVKEGSTPDGLILLMAGAVEQESKDGPNRKINAPHSFGSLQFLGTKLACEPLKATEFCETLCLSRKDILQCLTKFPEESTAMVLQVLRHNGRRMSLTRSSVCSADTNNDEPVLELNLWYLPFCKGLHPVFVEAFSAELELVKVVPGQAVFRNGADAEVLAVLLKGRILVRSPSTPERELRVPLLLCGRNRSSKVEATAVQLCDLHRLSTKSCDELAANFPEDMRILLDRAMTFQARVHAKLDYPWWSSCAALLHQSVFAESHHLFLSRVAEQLTLKIFLPGDELVVEGDRVDSTMIIESGEATVMKIDHRVTSMVSSSVVAEIQDGFWIGGVGGICGFAGELKRSATICARTVCKVHKLMNSVFVGLLSGFPEERHRFRQLAERQLQTRGDVESLEEHSFFKGLSRDLLNLLRPKCRPLVFFANEAIMNQGEPADSLFIFGAHADVSIEADGAPIREHKGRACLGVVALLSKWPVKRASTVVTRIACSVRSLSRSDWLEALKHHPEHRRWIESFTAQQLEKVGEARGVYRRRRAWDKIQTRETAATSEHFERIACQLGTMQGSCWANSTPRSTSRGSTSARQTPRSISCRGGGITPRLPTKAPPAPAPEGPSRPPSMSRRPTQKLDAQVVLESWPCFNGAQATVPHTRLPRLGGSGQAGSEADDGGEDRRLDIYEMASFSLCPQEGRQGRRRTVDIWQTCEQAIGMGESIVVPAG